MSKVYFLFGIHNHQPVGNDLFVFNKAFEDCYRPFLEVLKKFPEIKCNIHISGSLYDWILKNKPDYIKNLKEMSDKKQIEIVGGGYYEPILPVISDRDKFAQISLMSNFIKKEFGKKPNGMWLAERVWEPQLASVIRKSGLKYTFLDDVHFRSAGIRDKELSGYYFTEDSAKPIAVFPINKTLRFKIPFSKAEEAMTILKSFSQNKKDVLVTFFDDGEKFGLWSWTYDWIYKKKWLEKFFKLLVQNNKTVETITASEALKKFSPNRNVIYLPTSSYREMDEWVMEPEEFFYYNKLKEYLKKYKNHSEAAKFRNFTKAGFFRNFFRKYPRVNYMHKKMLYLSENIHKVEMRHCLVSAKDKNIFENLYKAQCNCGYWHGLFGGFYLGNIRAAIYENLIKVEKELDKAYNLPESSAERLQRGAKNSLLIEKADINLDGLPETIVKNSHLICVFSKRGATLLEMSYKDRNFNLLNTITRREEAHHQKIKDNPKDKINKEIIYDKYERLGLVDHLLSKKITVSDFDKQRNFTTLSDDVYELDILGCHSDRNERGTSERSGGICKNILKNTFHPLTDLSAPVVARDDKLKSEKESIILNYQYKNKNLEFTKKITLNKKAEIKTEYIFQKNALLKKYNFGVEYNIFFQSLKDVKFYTEKGEANLRRKRVFKKINYLKFSDYFKDIYLEFDFSEADVFILPIYSIANSQKGPEKSFQQASVLFIKKNEGDSFDLNCKLSKKAL